MPVLVVGGGAGVGKTTAARTLADWHGAGWLQLDTLWLALAEAAAPADRALLRVDAAIRQAAVAGDSSSATVQRLVEQHVAAARWMSAAVATAVWFEAETHAMLVVDGAWLLPDDVAALRDRVGEVRAAYLVEPDREALQATLDSRRAGRPAQRHHRLVGDVVWAYGQRLAREAEARGLAVVEARPFATQADRLSDALEVG